MLPNAGRFADKIYKRIARFNRPSFWTRMTVAA